MAADITPPGAGTRAGVWVKQSWAGLSSRFRIQQRTSGRTIRPRGATSTSGTSNLAQVKTGSAHACRGSLAALAPSVHTGSTAPARRLFQTGALDVSGVRDSCRCPPSANRFASRPDAICALATATTRTPAGAAPLDLNPDATRRITALSVHSLYAEPVQPQDPRAIAQRSHVSSPVGRNRERHRVIRCQVGSL
jgi:hypothetical protein